MTETLPTEPLAIQTESISPAQPKERVLWLDVAKFFGIFFIYSVHFHGVAGLGYPFTFTFAVQMFFFLSGCAEHLSAKRSFKDCLLCNVKGLLLPFFCFSLLSLTVNCITTNTAESILKDLLCIVKGNIRNAFLPNPCGF